MEKSDMKRMWQELNHANTSLNRVDVEDIIKKKHSKIISRTLNMQKIKVLLYSSFLLVYAALMTYAFAILKLNLSLHSVIPLSLAGLVLLIGAIFEINTLRLLQSTAGDVPVRESIVSFKQKLDHARLIEFLSTLVYCYSWAIGIVLVVANDFNGFIKRSLLFLILLILILLVIPWLAKYFYPRHKNLYASLDEDLKLLESE